MSVVHHDDICIAFSGVSFAYATAPVLSDINFTIPAGDYVGVIGPNGGGKTTLLKLLLGLLEPTTGTITICGHSVAKAKAHYEIGYVPQHVVQADAAFPATVTEVVMSGRTMRRGLFRGVSAADRRAVTNAMEITGVSQFATARLGELSGGQRQRVFIARALASEPMLLILDEPTVGVDMASVSQFNQVLARLNEDTKMTILLVSHDIDAVAAQVKHVLCINRRVVCHVPSREFKKEEMWRDVYGQGMRPVDHPHEH